MNEQQNSMRGAWGVNQSTGHMNFVTGYRLYKSCCEHREALPGKVGKVEELRENCKDVTSAVANVAKNTSSFWQFQQVEKVVTRAHWVGGVWWKHQSHVVKQFRSVQHDMHTVTTQREPCCTCDSRVGCKTRIFCYLPGSIVPPSSSLPLPFSKPSKQPPLPSHQLLPRRLMRARVCLSVPSLLPNPRNHEFAEKQ